VEVFYPVDRAAVPADATGYAYTPEEVWGPLVGLFPPGVVTTTAVPDAWMDAPASPAGPFPVVVFSHGWGAMRFSYTFHYAHLASWGFVVAGPEHLSRDLQARLTGNQSKLPPSDVATISATLDLLGSENSRRGGALEARIATDEVAVVGHSAGGRDAALAAALEEVDTWIALAGVPPVPDDAVVPSEAIALRPDFDLERYLRDHPSPAKPSMQIVAQNDTGVPPSLGRAAYHALPPPKRFVELADTGHIIFYDACASIQEQGGLQAVADALGLDRASPQIRLAEDGCLPGDAPVAPLAAVWNHLAVAQLDWVFDIDGDVAAASLEGDYLRATFPGTIKEYLVEDR
jgi:pimeloyl-ACP methyl ester carboxylesterase